MCKIQVHNLNYAYPHSGSKQILKSMDFTISEGEFICILGDSGCGKSTLLNILAGLLPFDSGQVLIDSIPVSGPDINRNILFQHNSLFPWLTVRKNIMFGIKQAKSNLSKKDVYDIATDHLEKVELLESEHKYPSQLSGGMQQRVAIARAFAMDSDIMFLDEPFGSLDPRIRNKLQEKLEELWKSDSSKKTVVFVTHDIEEAIMLADRIFFLSDGQIFKTIDINLNRPRHHRDIMQLPECCATRKMLIEMFYESQDKMGTINFDSSKRIKAGDMF